MKRMNPSWNLGNGIGLVRSNMGVTSSPAWWGWWGWWGWRGWRGWRARMAAHAPGDAHEHQREAVLLILTCVPLLVARGEELDRDPFDPLVVYGPRFGRVGHVRRVEHVGEEEH